MQLHRLAMMFGSTTLLLLGAYACSSSDNNTDTGTPDSGTDTGAVGPVDTGIVETPDTGTTTDAGDAGDAAAPGTCVGNPLLADAGTAATRVDGGLFSVASNLFEYGPQWIDELGGQVVYASADDHTVYRVGPDAGTGTPATPLFEMPDASFVPLQSDYYQGAIYTATATSYYPDTTPPGGSVFRIPLDGGAVTSFPLPGATVSSPNGIAISQKGYVFIADPAFQVSNAAHSGVFRMKVDGTGLTAVNTTGGDYPVGVALNKDQTRLYISYFSYTNALSKLVYINLDAQTGLPTGDEVAFTTVTPIYGALGIAVDQGGNVWVAESNNNDANGVVEVYSADGTKKWATINVPAHATGVGFGGTDRTKVFITTENGDSTNGTLYSLSTRCPGTL